MKSPVEVMQFVSVESQANCQENPTLLLIERAKNPIIMQQIIDLHLRAEKAQDGRNYYTAKTREELENEYKKRLRKIEKSTPILFNTKKRTSTKGIVLDDRSFSTWATTTLQRSSIEAHEKGHILRDYHDNFYDAHFLAAFSYREVDYTIEDFEHEKSLENEPRLDQIKFEDYKFGLRESLRSYLLTGEEISERMAQLKNYFGFKGSETFTKGHLQYAKEHYLKDGWLDNNMRQFFQAVTPAREEKFIDLINTSGI